MFCQHEQRTYCLLIIRMYYNMYIRIIFYTNKTLHDGFWCVLICRLRNNSYQEHLILFAWIVSKYLTYTRRVILIAIREQKISCIGRCLLFNRSPNILDDEIPHISLSRNFNCVFIEHIRRITMHSHSSFFMLIIYYFVSYNLIFFSHHRLCLFEELVIDVYYNNLL